MPSVASWNPSAVVTSVLKTLTSPPLILPLPSNKETDHVTGLEGKSGNPAPFTALGTFLGIKAAVKHKLGKDTVEGVSVAVQGLGSVGLGVCKLLSEEGAKLYVTDINDASISKAVNEFGANPVALEEIYDLPVDVYAPCALGATINDDTLDRIQCSIVAGCANNQLAEPRHGTALLERGILYAPDYVINAGGIINVSFENDADGYCADKSTAKVNEIYNTLTTIFERSDKEGRGANFIADKMAQEIIYG